jgi:hypothetical protein
MTRSERRIYTLNNFGNTRAVCTAAASASVNPISTLWFGCLPKPARSIVDRNRSTVGTGFQVVGTLKINSIFASSHRFASSPSSFCRMVWYNNLKKSQYLPRYVKQCLFNLGPKLTAAQLLESTLDIRPGSAGSLELAGACPHPRMS